MNAFRIWPRLRNRVAGSRSGPQIAAVAAEDRPSGQLGLGPLVEPAVLRVAQPPAQGPAGHRERVGDPGLVKSDPGTAQTPPKSNTPEPSPASPPAQTRTPEAPGGPARSRRA